MKARLDSNQLGLIAAAYIVQFLYVVVGRYAISNIVVAGYELIYHPALQNRRELLFRHPLVIAILTGLALGLLPLQAIASGFGSLSKPPELWSQSWRQATAWVMVPFALILLVSATSYVEGAPANALTVWQSFFAAPCDLDAAHVLLYGNGCANQLLFTAPLTSTLVYSLTVLIDRRRNSAGRRSLLAASGTGEIV